MTDGRIPGKWMNEPRFIEMSADTWTVFTKAIAWSNEAGTDGFIKWRYLSLFHPDGEQPQAHAELVALGLWTKTASGYQLTDWSKPAHQGGLGQATAEQVQQGKARNRRAQAAYRARQNSGGDDGPGGGQAVSDDVSAYVSDDVGQDRTGQAQTEAKPRQAFKSHDPLDSGEPDFVSVRSVCLECGDPVESGQARHRQCLEDAMRRTA